MNTIFRRRSVDYVTWMMDDHVLRWDRGWQYPGAFEEEMAFHLQHARKVLVISPSMAEFYKRRFGVESQVLFGPADPIGAPLYQVPDPSGPVRLCYFGALWTWQGDALGELAARLPALGATLDIYTHHDLPAWAKGEGVRALPPVPAQEVMRLIREYDGVVITASSKEQSRALTELNIGTKLSECLASGTVTVVVGPEYAAMARFLAIHGGALIITDVENPTQLARIRSLKMASFREEILNQARKTAELCSVDAMRSVWQRCWVPQ
jgi:hypothetical protein